MEEYIEISSDSSNSDQTIVVENNEIDNIIKKYIDDTNQEKHVPSISHSTSNDNLYTLDDFSDEDFNLEPLRDRIKGKHEDIEVYRRNSSVDEVWDESNNLNTIRSQISEFEKQDCLYKPQFHISKELNNLINAETVTDIEKHSTDNLSEPISKKLKMGQLDKEVIKAAKVKEREQKRIEKEQQKQLKRALKIVENYIKPDKCIEYIIVNIDENLSNGINGEVIKTGLKSGNYNYKVSKEIVPNLVSWTRKIPSVTNNLLQSVLQCESHYLLVIEITEFLQHIDQKSFIVHIQSFLSLSEVKHLSVALMGLPKYYKYLQDEKNKQFQNVATRKNTTDYMTKPTKKEINSQLVQLQVFCKNVYVKSVDKYEDLVMFIIECTKAVAQIPHKAARAETLSSENEFFYGSNKDCVKVDKDGNGLSRLWNQCLRMFPLASLETAEAISSSYPTMQSLMKAYDSCKTREEGEKLLQDIVVRRAAGPLGGSKRIGPELSRKIYLFFNSNENDIL